MRLLPWTCVLLPVLACGGGGGAPHAPGAEVPAVATLAAPADPLASTPGCPALPSAPAKDLPGSSKALLTVLDPGAEPRQELRYRPRAGTRVPMTLRTDLEIDIGIAALGQQMHVLSPTSVMRATADILEVGDDGTIVQRMVIEEAYVEPRTGSTPEMEQAMTAELDTMACDVIVQRFDAHGYVMAVRVIGEGALATSLDQLDGLSNPLPAVPVGVGASWQVTEHLIKKGITMDRTITYDLLGIDGDVVHLRGTIDVGAQPQVFMQDGAAFDLRRVSGLGSFETDLDLVTMIPTAHNETALAMEMSSQGVDLVMDMKLRMSAVAR